MALKRIWIPSPNYSSRGGSRVRLIVLHTAEGALTIESLGGYFSNSSVQASSHVGADDKVNTVGEFVKRENKAWTQSQYNPVSVSMELCAFSSWSAAEWNRHPNMLANCAAWIAEEAAYFGIPIQKLTPSQAQGSGRGVCQHKDLGAAGGGHHDCGPDFPIDQVLEMARGGTPPPPEGTMAISVGSNADGRLAVFVQLESGEVKHCEQQKPNSDWWKNDDGTYKWLTMGNPGK